ncbi:UDP-GalNAc:beta-1,3-N-acetylgalactosaminyltransferase 2-like isoform X1 [Acropora muricata]|uniref:UDP-GalNAc:beta-1, 3-N-acetylgalactosaminyltransferase 2-like isoform X1 n=1 Tax=Acropora muricata TaxID=159855 RepID=UPI0034E49146
MPGRLQLLLVSFGVVWQLIQISEYLTTEDDLQTQKKGTRLQNYDLVIGILSARGNHEQRQAIRDTWLGHVLKISFLQERVIVKFVVGDEPCPVPPIDRLDQYSCQPELEFNPVVDRDIIAHRFPKEVVGCSTHRGSLGIDFRVNFPIVITQLGVFDCNLDGLQNGLTTRLYDRISQVCKEVLSINFTADDPGMLISGSRFKPVLQYLLPKGFEGSIVAENFSLLEPGYNNPTLHVELDSGGGLVTFEHVIRFGDHKGVFPKNEERLLGETNQFAAGTFIYRAYVAGTEFAKLSAEEIRKQREERLKRWREVLLREQNELQREMSLNDDILLVNVVDVYRNLPRKLLKFYSWSVQNLRFSFTLKTDDDCFVNVEAIIAALNERKLREKESVWWGRFRSDWPVERVGKWREPDYTASVYPSFACGAGNVLSADLVKWLTLNVDHLKSYQGEDVSMGIWLSAVAPIIVNDDRWACGRECDTEIFTSPENDPEELREIWTDFQQCGDPCGCSEKL